MKRVEKTQSWSETSYIPVHALMVGKDADRGEQASILDDIHAHNLD